MKQTHSLLMKIISICIMTGLFCIILFNVFLDYPINSDDAATLLHWYSVFEQGWSYYPMNISFFHIFSLIGYGIFGVSIKAVYFGEMLNVMLLLFLSLAFVSKDIKKISQYWGVFVVFFCLSVTQAPIASFLMRYHNNVNICYLIAIILLDGILFRNKYSIWYYILFCFFSLYAFIPFDSLNLIVCTVPMLIIIFLYCRTYNKKEICAKGKILGGIIVTCAVFGKIINLIFQNLYESQNPHGLYNDIILVDIETFFYNIKCYFTALLDLFNANFYNSSLFSLSTAFYFGKILFVAVALFLVFIEIWKAIRMRDFDPVIALIGLSTIMLFLAYSATNVNVDMKSARYMNVIVYLFPIVICRKAILSDFINMIKPRIKYALFTFSIVMLLVSFMFTPKLDFKRVLTKQDRLRVFLTENNFEYGFAPFWSSTHTMASSLGELKLQSICQQNDTAFFYQFDVYDFWLSDPNAFFNFIVIPKQQPDEDIPEGLITEELILNIYGDPYVRHEIDEYIIYEYNFDIRNIGAWAKKTYKYNNNWEFVNEYVLAKENEILLLDGGLVFGPYMDLDEGTYSITVTGDNLEHIDFKATSDLGINPINNTTVLVSNQTIVYEIKTDIPLNNAEFVLQNNCQDIAAVKYITIEKK